MDGNGSASPTFPTNLPASNEESTAYKLEWNFMASRVNAILAIMRAHRDLHIPLELQYVSDGLTIERVSTPLSDIASSPMIQ